MEKIMFEVFFFSNTKTKIKWIKINKVLFFQPFFCFLILFNLSRIGLLLHQLNYGDFISNLYKFVGIFWEDCGMMVLYFFNSTLMFNNSINNMSSFITICFQFIAQHFFVLIFYGFVFLFLFSVLILWRFIFGSFALLGVFF